MLQGLSRIQAYSFIGVEKCYMNLSNNLCRSVGTYNVKIDQDLELTRAVKAINVTISVNGLVRSRPLFEITRK